MSSKRSIWFWVCCLIINHALHSEASAQSVPTAGEDYFEKRIRPLLAEHCFECHSEKKQKGGLRLDSREGWAKGGESGPALVAGDVEKSRLITAVRYRDKEFQMPPKRRLTDPQIADLEQWVKMGAPDPRTTATTAGTKLTGMSVEAGRKLWVYQPVKPPTPPTVKDAAWPRGDMDRFILARIEAKQLQPAPDADRATLARRVYYDLIGLPPTPEQVDAFVNDAAPDAFAKLVDTLLASPHFGERWGRHWLDVARYAESLTLRGFVLKDAWRYRDYVIESFNADRPYDQFVREQIAGDLLAAPSLEERRRQLVATTFLALGNTNLEEQDKKQLVMDVVDEQLETLGKAFLAQTIGCARCHDHKFDPIPTADYYALAGILKSTRTLEHSNVSKWLELPLPVEPGQERVFKEHETAVAALQARIKDAKDAEKKVAAQSPASKTGGVLDPKTLAGIVVDDTQAKRVGDWTASKFSGRFIGEGYLHDGAADKGRKTLTFLPELPRAGRYEVRLAYVPGTNRADAVPVTVFSADGEKTLHVNQKEEPPIDGRFLSLGQFRFELNGQGFVIVANEGKGHVVADAVQFIPAELKEAGTVPAVPTPAIAAKLAKPIKDSNGTKGTKVADVKSLEADLKQLQEKGPHRPTYISVREEDKIADAPVHVRGSAHNLGAMVPRGFLQVASTSAHAGAARALPAGQSGRKELADWLASAENPLTARVMANRTWHWLFGAGLVRTVDNFGITGEAPSHPELLDYLAARFVKEGWSVKKLVREMVLSRTYQLSSAATPPQEKADADNRLFTHAHRRRLDAEAIRDTLLLASGKLQLQRGGPTLRPDTNADYAYKHDDTRRSVYAPVLRNALPELFEVFDFADPSVTSGARNTSTVATQALFLMNHPFVLEQSKAAAERTLAAKPTDDAARLHAAWRLALGRAPSERERQLALAHLAAAGDKPAARISAWTQIWHALFASVDFRHVN